MAQNAKGWASVTKDMLLGSVAMTSNIAPTSQSGNPGGLPRDTQGRFVSESKVVQPKKEEDEKPTDDSPEKQPETKKRKRGVNPWLEHVKAFRTAHPGMKFKEVLIQAKATYSKVKK